MSVLLNADGGPMSGEEFAHIAISAIIARYVATAVATVRSGDPAQSAASVLDELHGIHLAEPWLPATEALQALVAAGWTPPETAPAAPPEPFHEPAPERNARDWEVYNTLGQTVADGMTRADATKRAYTHTQYDEDGPRVRRSLR